MLANDGLSNKPKEDRIVKFRDPDDMKDGSHRSVVRRLSRHDWSA